MAPLAVLVALMAILVYVAMRFEWRFAVGSVIALVHDVTIVVGMFALLQIEFDLPVLAAVLAVIGYSLNDTIVVFDRIRENFRKMRKGTTIGIIDISLTETLSRTLVTSMTTILVLLALFFLGGEIIHGFAFALLVGVLIGTYSSIYVASTSVLMLGRQQGGPDAGKERRRRRRSTLTGGIAPETGRRPELLLRPGRFRSLRSSPVSENSSRSLSSTLRHLGRHYPCWSGLTSLRFAVMIVRPEPPLGRPQDHNDNPRRRQHETGDPGAARRLRR
jgi:multidrug efflux pump subunit AcrB